MRSAEDGMPGEPLETAADLEKAGIIKRGCAYKLAKAGKIVHYAVGEKQTGVRFRRSEVLAALRRPAVFSKADKCKP